MDADAGDVDDADASSADYADQLMIMTPAQVHAVPEEDYVALPYNSMERPVINGEDSVPLKFTISWVSSSDFVFLGQKQISYDLM